VGFVLLLLSVGYVVGADSPQWWRDTRAIYCPAATTGAGSALMKYTEPELRDQISSFTELVRFLEDAKKLGCNVIYLVDWWEPKYTIKGDYKPYASLGGADALREGIREIHKRGGKIILYLEAFIVSRTSEVGRWHGPQWAMMSKDGWFYPYQRTGSRYYLMYPGPGSGWAEYLANLCKRLVEEYDIDGVHLDSCGYQWNWQDFHPRHPGADNPQTGFNKYAVELVKLVQARMREVKEDAIVMIEGDDREELLEVCDGAQSSGWECLSSRPWFKERKYKIFSSDYSVELMEKTLKAGYGISLAEYWLGGLPTDRMIRNLKKSLRWENWRFIQQALYWVDNILYVNGFKRPYQIHRLVKIAQEAMWGKPHDEAVDVPEFEKMRQYYIGVAESIRQEKDLELPGEYVRQLLEGN